MGLVGADDRARTGDLDLGKVALYQLSYVRVNVHISPRTRSGQHEGQSVDPMSLDASSSM